MCSSDLVGDAEPAEHAVLIGDLLADVAEDWVIGVVFLGEPRVVLEVVDADHVIGDVEFPKQLAALTERIAFGRSTTGKRFWKPRKHDRLLALGFRQRVSLAI